MLLRKAINSDWKNLLQWRNDPTTRENSFTQQEIEVEEHKEWLSRSLESSDREIYILEDDNNLAVGTIRSDKTKEGSFILSWNIASEHRGKGYGNKLLELFLQYRSGNFIAEIKPSNTPSIKMVEKNGFQKIGENTYKKSQLSDLEIIDAIQQVRNKNNVNWMDILRIAFKYSPEETREVFKKITDSDNEINNLSKMLANNG